MNIITFEAYWYNHRENKEIFYEVSINISSIKEIIDNKDGCRIDTFDKDMNDMNKFILTKKSKKEILDLINESKNSGIKNIEMMLKKILKTLEEIGHKIK